MKHATTIACIAAAALLPLAPDALAARRANPPVEATVVDDAALDDMTGRYMGANMLVGLRIELVSTLQTSDGGTAGATGALQVVRDGGGGFLVAVDTRSGADAGSGGAAPAGVATGGSGLQIGGIGQVIQIAGDGNDFSNLASITFARHLPGTSGFNGQAHSGSTDGLMTARISFLEGGMALQLTAPGALVSQSLAPGAAAATGSFMQVGQLFGNDISGANRMQLTLLTEQMSEQAIRQLGTQLALSGLGGL
jgi:hypothetical protein